MLTYQTSVALLIRYNYLGGKVRVEVALLHVNASNNVANVDQCGAYNSAYTSKNVHCNYFTRLVQTNVRCP